MQRIWLALAFAGILIGAAQAQERRTMEVSIPAADHGWDGGVAYFAMQEGKALEKKYPGLKVIVKASPDTASQANTLGDISTQRIDALVVMPRDRDSLTDSIRKVRERGAFVTVVERISSDHSIYDLYVGGDNPGLGAAAVKYIKEKLGGKGDIVIIRGQPIPIDEGRYNGFMEGLKGTDIKVLDSQYGNRRRDDAFKVMQDFLSKHPHIDAVWAQDDDMALGALEAIRQAKRADIEFVVGGGGGKEMIERILNGDPMAPADVLYPPGMVAAAMELTALGLEEGVPVRGDYILSATLVTKQNAKKFYYKDSPF